LGSTSDVDDLLALSGTANRKEEDGNIALWGVWQQRSKVKVNSHKTQFIAKKYLQLSDKP